MAKRRARVAKSGKLFAEPQTEFFEKSVQELIEEESRAKVECLGLTFDNDAARREHFLAKLRERLVDPEFRRTPGFPQGSDEDILRLSDPPWYTVCPNPFLEDFVRIYGRPYNPLESYEREPFAVDTSVGKTDALYKAHGYHTKVPHLAIVPSILHYTKPGDIVLDGFCGTGMTGVAAQWCGTAPKEYRQQLEGEWAAAGRDKPAWGTRRAILGDLGPAATFIAAGYNLPFNVRQFAAAAKRILDEVEDELGWMYETLHTDGKTKGCINFTVWSEVFSCPQCAGEIVFSEHASDVTTQRQGDDFSCPHCSKDKLTKKLVTKSYVHQFDQVLRASVRLPKRVPVLINYTVGATRYDKVPSAGDMDLIDRIARLGMPPRLPVDRMMHVPEEQECWGDEWRAGVAAFSHVHHLFLPRPAHSLSVLLGAAEAIEDHTLRRAVLFFVEQAIWGMSVMNRYVPTHYSQVNQYMSGRIRVLSRHAECSPRYVLGGKLERLAVVFKNSPARVAGAAVSTGDCARIPLASGSIDYVFTDPPFGSNFAYAELNFIVESWHGVFTGKTLEAIVSETQGKGLREYQSLMHRCFAEYYRVLKPGRWATVVFSNSSHAVWRAIQEALGIAGFVVADVRTLDKQQASFNQLRGIGVKQDLIVSAYKPSTKLEEGFRLQESTDAMCWSFVDEHQRNLPVVTGRGDDVEVLAERTAHMLYDRMIAFHVQRGVAVPLSGSEFIAGLDQRYPERDGMYFLPEQVSEYDRRRMGGAALKQLVLFVSDEATAIQWLRQQLQFRPQTRQDITPRFTKEIHTWAKHEATVDLRDMLEQNFLCHDGKDDVPPQIHSYLSSNYKECRNLQKDDATLKEKAKGRWYVPDPAKQGDLEKIRARKLLSEFETYKSSKDKKLKQFRTEAVRAGFKAAYDAQDYAAIVQVAAKVPESVLQEDEKLLMYYDVAATRLGD